MLSSILEPNLDKRKPYVDEPAAGRGLDLVRYFWHCGNMKPKDVARFADMFAALGSEPRLEIMRLLLSAHPEGMTPGQLQEELNMPASTLSHHLEKLRIEGLVNVRKDRQWLWYSANSRALEELLAFLYAECCKRSGAVRPSKIL
jgi:ATP-dependent Clp protease ATP-binding subunit ClpC